jgi:hypothetical protein
MYSNIFIINTIINMLTVNHTKQQDSVMTLGTVNGQDNSGLISKGVVIGHVMYIRALILQKN